jgi:hypothetical protein
MPVESPLFSYPRKISRLEASILAIRPPNVRFSGEKPSCLSDMRSLPPKYDIHRNKKRRKRRMGRKKKEKGKTA